MMVLSVEQQGGGRVAISGLPELNGYSNRGVDLQPAGAFERFLIEKKGPFMQVELTVNSEFKTDGRILSEELHQYYKEQAF